MNEYGEKNLDNKAILFVKSLIGKKLVYFCCEANMFDFGFDEQAVKAIESDVYVGKANIDFGFNEPLVLHAMGCSRVIKNDDILVTTLDYDSWDQIESTNNDEWFNMEKFNSQIIGGTVISVEVSSWHDLHIGLDNGVTIECMIANAYPHYEEESEQWVLFDHTKKHNGTFLTVYNKSVDFDD